MRKLFSGSIALFALAFTLVFGMPQWAAEAGIEHRVFTGFEDPNNIPPIDDSDGV